MIIQRYEKVKKTTKILVLVSAFKFFEYFSDIFYKFLNSHKNLTNYKT